MAITDELDGVFDFLRNNAASQALTENPLPLIDNAISALDPSELDFFSDLQDQIQAALASLPGAPTAQDIADAINGAAITGVSATAAGDDVNLSLQATDTSSLTIPDTAFSIGITELGLTAEAGLTTTLQTDLDITLAFNINTDNITLVDGVGPELKIGLTVAADINASGDLGFLGVAITDQMTDPSDPEIDLDFSVDLISLTTFGIDVTATGDIDLKLGMVTIAPGDNPATPENESVLPEFSADLVLHWNSATGTPLVMLDNIQVDLGALVDMVADTFRPLLDIMDDFPIGDIIDGLTTPLPLIDDLAHAVGLMGLLDIIPDEFPDDVINLLDLTGAYFLMQGNQGAYDALSKFAIALGILQEIAELDDAGDVGKITLGSYTLSEASPALAGVAPAAIGPPGSSFTPEPDILGQLQSLLGGSDIFDDVLGAVNGVLADISPNPLGGDGLVDGTGLSFPILEHPEDVINILLPGLGGGPVDLIKYDLPALTTEAQLGPFFFPVLGPIGISLVGMFGAGIDVDLVYDTGGLETGDLLDGLVLATNPTDNPLTPEVEEVPHDNPDHNHAFLPAAYSFAEVHAGAGVSLVFVGIFLEGGILGDANAFFPGDDGELRVGELIDSGCLFDPLEGRLAFELSVRLTIGFGFFSWSHRFSLAEVTLVEFSFGCDGHGESDPGFALARLTPDLVNGPDLLLHVGPEANHRSFGGVVGTDVGESYHITNAVNEDGVLIPATLTVDAFGTKENYAPAGGPINLIVANFGEQNDALVIAADVTQAATVSGGNGHDDLTGGSGNDTFSGENGDDRLVGGIGNDCLIGGNNDDFFEGGVGADTIQGGDGRDQMSYEHSAVGVRFLPTATPGDFTGSFGDAEGDIASSIEYIVGSNFNDTLFGSPTSPTDLGNTLEGRGGNDVLVGGNKRDFLLGGAGGDYISGARIGHETEFEGEDGTSYIGSYGGVTIDLQFKSFFGGEANGDFLVSIEDVQGSAYYDRLLGNGFANYLDGWWGDDVLEGRGGADTLIGDLGHDTIRGSADGDQMDGGFGHDLLDYSFILGPVTVNMHDLQGAGGDQLAGFAVLISDGVDPDPDLFFITGLSTFEDLDGTFSASGDNLRGDIGYNRIRGFNGNDTIDGDGGNDTLVGGAGADVLKGGTDDIPGLAGVDGYSGSGGTDLADYDDSYRVEVNLELNFGHFSNAEGDTFESIEDLRGSVGADTLTGSSFNNEIDPSLSTFSGIDTVNGLGGFDTLVIDYSRQDYGQGMIGGFDLGSLSSGNFRRMDAPGTSVLDGVDFEQMEALRVVGTFKADEVYGGFYGDVISTGGGDDLILTGIGSDHVYAGRGNDTVMGGTDADRELSFGGGLFAFDLVGDRGIDHLSISLANYADDIVLNGTLGLTEFHGTNLSLSDGSAARQFEVLGNVITGFGDDSVSQPGDFDNEIYTGYGVDVIRPGLGNDNVDGGFDFQYGREIGLVFNDGGGENGFFSTVVTDYQAFEDNPGDLLILDYSSWEGPDGVSGNVFLTQSQIDVEYFNGTLQLFTNQGSYGAGFDGDFAEHSVDFYDIERLDVTGSNQDDYLVGTFDTFAELPFGEGQGLPFGEGSNIRGNDTFNGLAGNDTIIGNTGDDLLLGAAGDDVLIGTDPNTYTSTEFIPEDGPSPASYSSFDPNPSADSLEVDVMTGGEGADQFVFGTLYGYFYASFSESYPTTNRGIVTDFTPADGDSIVLHGRSNDYYTQEIGVDTDSDGFIDSTTTLIFREAGSTFADQLIGEVQNFSGFDLDADYVQYLGFADTSPGDGIGGFGIESEDPGTFALAASETEEEPEETPPVTTLAVTDWITQTNDIATLRNALFGGGAPSGLVDSGPTPIELVGDGLAFGTFSGDPFGLGSGIVLSTGAVEDLDEPNEEDGGFFPPVATPLTFEHIGSFGGSGIFRADISGLGVDIQSILLQDSNSHVGGSGGEASGFDLDAIALSSFFLDDTTGVDLNALNATLGLDVFEFSAAGMLFTPGSQRPATGSNFPNAPDMFGAVGNIVNNAVATLGSFDVTGSFDTGWVTLGDGGSLGFNLTAPVSSDGPLYLYVAEAGDNDESLAGLISVSSGRVDAPTDLSTDFGLPGTDNDTTSFTYRFTATGDVNAVTFDFILFSEELMEFAGTEFNDTFKIMLNGVNMAQLSDGAAMTVNSLAASPFGPYHPDLILNPDIHNLLPLPGPVSDSFRADAYTQTLTFIGGLQAGENVLTIEVADVRDGLLDSGMLIQGGTLNGGTGGGGFGFGGPFGPGFGLTVGDIQTGATPSVTEGGASVLMPVALNLGGAADLVSPVTVTFSTGPDLDFGNGPGVDFTHTFNPGGPFTFNLEVKAPNDGLVEGTEFGVIDISVSSPDPLFDGIPVAPAVVEILDAPEVVSDMEVAFGNLGGAGQWYLTSTTPGITPIDWPTLPGPHPAVASLNMLTDTAVGPWSNTLVFGGLVLANTVVDANSFDVVGRWDSVKNMQAKATTAEHLTFDGVTQVDVEIGTGTTDGSDVTIIGAARANVITGEGDDHIAITFASNVNNTTTVDAFRISSGGGDDTIEVQPLKLAAEAATDPTFVKDAANGPLNSNMQFVRAHISAGDGNDTVRGGRGNDRVDAGTGDDSVYGDHGDDLLMGGDGNDTMRGGPGRDTVLGGDGDDDLGAADSDDVLDGGEGNDILRANAGGASGNSVLIGGDGDDLFLFTPKLNTHIITDFETSASGGGDIIDLHLLPGLNTFNQLKTMMSEVAGNVIIDLSSITGPGGEIIIENVKVDDLHPSDFVL